MRTEPLFIRYANGISKPIDVIESVFASAKDDRTRDIARKAKGAIPNLEVFRRDLRKAIEDLIDTGINQHFVNYVDSYMKPSLLEHVEDAGIQNAGEKRQISLKSEDTPWIEAVVCYNMCLYIKMYGIKEIKLCPVCNKFFSHKGKYAKYCSDACKGSKK